MRKLAIVSLVLAALGGTTGAANEIVPIASMDGPWEMITFEVNSWGHPLSSWIMTPDGGSWTEAVGKPGGPFGAADLVVHEVGNGAARMRELAAIVARLPSPAPQSDGCKNFLTDAPYGKIRMTRGATTIELSYNAGCMDPPYLKFLDTLKAADQLVAGWGKAGKVLRTDSYPPAR